MHDLTGCSVRLGGPDNGTEVDTGMVPIAFVLDGDHGVDEVAGYVVPYDERPIFAGMPVGQDRPVGGIHDRGEGALADARIVEWIDGEAAGARQECERQPARSPASVPAVH